MRVIAGSARGRRLREPADERVRPTTDRVKEAMFSILQWNLPGSRVLDLFGGTGQLGIEAVSRGAESAVIADSAAASVDLIRQNVRTAGLADRIRVVRGDSLQLLRTGEKYDVILMDPPYDTDLLEKSLKIVLEIDILKDNGIIVCESKMDKRLPALPAPYGPSREYRYGKIKLTVYRKNCLDSEDEA